MEPVQHLTLALEPAALMPHVLATSFFFSLGERALMQVAWEGMPCQSLLKCCSARGQHRQCCTRAQSVR